MLPDNACHRRAQGSPPYRYYLDPVFLGEDNSSFSCSYKTCFPVLGRCGARACLRATLQLWLWTRSQHYIKSQGETPSTGPSEYQPQGTADHKPKQRYLQTLHQVSSYSLRSCSAFHCFFDRHIKRNFCCLSAPQWPTTRSYLPLHITGIECRISQTCVTQQRQSFFWSQSVDFIPNYFTQAFSYTRHTCIHSQSYRLLSCHSII